MSEITLATLADTEQFGRRLADRLFAGAVVALIGPLGAGKTTLTQAIAVALGADPRQVASPTFALVHEYAGRLPIYHFDTYRLPDVKSFIALGVEEYFQGEGVCVIEWADRVVDALPAEHLQIQLAHDGDGRRALVTGFGERYSALAAGLLEPA